MSGDEEDGKKYIFLPIIPIPLVSKLDEAILEKLPEEYNKAIDHYINAKIELLKMVEEAIKARIERLEKRRERLKVRKEKVDVE